MVLLVGCGKLLRRHLQVGAQHAQLGIAQHLLNRLPAGPARKHLHGQRIAKGLRRHLLIDVGLLNPFFEILPDPLPGQRPAMGIEENRCLVAIGQLRPNRLQVTLKPVNSWPPQRHHPLVLTTSL